MPVFSSLDRIREGLGDKFGILMQYMAQLVAGFIVAFIYSWKLTLVMMSLTPLMAGSAWFMSKVGTLMICFELGFEIQPPAIGAC